VTEPPPPPPALVEDAVQVTVVPSGVGELNGQPTPPEPDDILPVPLPDAPDIVDAPYLSVEPLHVEMSESPGLDQPDLDELALDEL